MLSMYPNPTHIEEEEDDSENEYSPDGSPPLPPYTSNPNSSASSTDSSPFSSHSQSPQVADPAEFVCQDCGVTYSRAPDLRRHRSTVHGEQDTREKSVNTWPCAECGSILLSSHGYQGHMRRHFDERPFVCEHNFCGKAFHDSATLARHRRTHSAEHKFECDFCGRRFKRKDNLNTHRKKHQIGGEAINPNLLRKPVTRLATVTTDPTPPASTPNQSAYPYVDATIASPPYQPPQPPSYSVGVPQPQVPTRSMSGNIQMRAPHPQQQQQQHPAYNENQLLGTHQYAEPSWSTQPSQPMYAPSHHPQQQPQQPQPQHRYHQQAPQHHPQQQQAPQHQPPQQHYAPHPQQHRMSVSAGHHPQLTSQPTHPYGVKLEDEGDYRLRPALVSVAHPHQHPQW